MELLDYLTECIGCDYLSDLKLRVSHAAVKRVLTTVRAQDYPMREWEDAADYLLGRKRSFESADDALEYLLRSL